MCKPYFRAIHLIILFLSIGAALFSQGVGISTAGSTPSTNSVLDLETGNTTYKQGFILPHINLGASLTVFDMSGTATTSDTGMLAYNVISASQNQPPGLYYWNGSKWISSASNELIGIIFLTSSTTTTGIAFARGTTSIRVKLVGGGGGGGGVEAALLGGYSSAGGGGGSGSYSEVYVNGLTSASTYTATIGSGGGGATGDATGTAGGTTTFSYGTGTTSFAQTAAYTAHGGSGGSGMLYGGEAVGGGAGGTAGTGTLTYAGNLGGGGLESGTTFALGGVGAASFIGGSGAEAIVCANGGSGSATGGAATSNTGSGGGGAAQVNEGLFATYTGGAGATGVVIIYEYK